MSLKDMMGSMNKQMQDPKTFADKNGGGYERDERFFIIGKDKDGSGSVKIRFIPSFNGDKTKLNTFITRDMHVPENTNGLSGDNFKKRFITEMCPKTVHGKDAECPICDYTWDNYNALKEIDPDEAKKFPKKFASKSKYISNILILEDLANPENVGKVFLYEYGEQVHKLIKASMQPTEEEIKEKEMEPFNAWDFEEGRDFRLKLVGKKFTENGFPTWDQSFFSAKSSAVASKEEEMMEILDRAYNLDEFISDKAVPTVEHLQAQLDYVLFKDPKKKQGSSVGESASPSKPENEKSLSSVAEMESESKPEPEPEQKVVSNHAEEKSDSTAAVVDDVESFFASMDI